MTYNFNYPGNFRSEFRASCKEMDKQSRPLYGRWRLLAHRHGLKPRLRHSMGMLFDWAEEVWYEGECELDKLGADKDYVPHDPTHLDWIAFICGGAHTCMRAFDFDTGRLPEFVAVAHYVSDLETSTNDIRLLRVLSTRVLEDDCPRLADLRYMGSKHAEWWLEKRLQRWLPWNKLRIYRRFGPSKPEPAAYCDMLAAERMRDTHELH